MNFCHYHLLQVSEGTKRMLESLRRERLSGSLSRDPPQNLVPRGYNATSISISTRASDSTPTLTTPTHITRSSRGLQTDQRRISRSSLRERDLPPQVQKYLREKQQSTSKRKPRKNRLKSKMGSFSVLEPIKGSSATSSVNVSVLEWAGTTVSSPLPFVEEASSPHPRGSVNGNHSNHSNHGSHRLTAHQLDVQTHFR